MMADATSARSRSMFRRGPILRAIPWALLTIGIVCAFIVPLIVLVVMAFRSNLPGLPGEWTLDGFRSAFTDGAVVKPLIDSLIFAVASSIGATSLALFFVFITTRTVVRLRRLVTPMMIVILATPALFFALSWAMLGAPRVGLINQLFGWVTGTPGSFTISSWIGLIMVMTLKLSSFCYFLLLGPSMNMNRSLEEAAEVAGSGRAGGFFRVYLPLMSPSIIGSLLIGFIASLQAFDTPQIIGLPAGIRVFSTEIFRLIRSLPPNYAGAAAFSLGLVLILAALVWFQLSLLKRRDYTTVAGKSTQSSPWRFPRTGPLFTLAIVVFGFFALLLPTVQLVLSSFNTVFGRYDSFSLHNYHEIFTNDLTMKAVLNTVQFMVFGGFVTVAFATVITYALRSRQTTWKRVLEMPTWIPWATPGLVGGLAILGTILAIPALHPIYGTSMAMLVALSIISIPIAMRFVESAVLQIDRQLMDAARISGAGAGRSFVSILIPLIAPSFISGWFVTGLSIAGNLEIPLLLGTLKETTIAGLAYKFYVDSLAPLAAAIFCVLLATVLILFVVGLILQKLLKMFIQRRARSIEALLRDSEPEPPSAAHAASDRETVAAQR